MSQVLFASDATPSLVDLDANFTELYSGVLIGSGNPIGYKAGSGGAVTQLTSKSTGVTLSKPSGAITTHAASLAANTSVTFTLTSTSISAYDVVAVSVVYAPSGAQNYSVISYSAGTAQVGIRLRNDTGGALAEAVIIGFVVIKGAAT